MSDNAITVAAFTLGEQACSDPDRRLPLYRCLQKVNPHLLFGYRMHGIDARHYRVRYEMERKLGMRSWLADGGTAVFADMDVFAPQGEGKSVADAFGPPPTAVVLQLGDAGPASTPVFAVAGLLSHASGRRSVQASHLAAYHHQMVTLPSSLDSPGSGASVGALMVGGLRIERLPLRGAHVPSSPTAVQVVGTMPPVLDVANLQKQLGAEAGAVLGSGPSGAATWFCSSPELLSAWGDTEIVDTEGACPEPLLVARLHRDTLSSRLLRLAGRAA
ncbi:hypothetical protein ACFU99_03500 [Streptomyces sp. NPDC057654]|uniref:hypothetical protein n=1 Tax=Streptomyces sp. NPDC057654 TaxID=3346196 RepID=UPI00369248CC